MQSNDEYDPAKSHGRDSPRVTRKRGRSTDTNTNQERSFQRGRQKGLSEGIRRMRTWYGLIERWRVRSLEVARRIDLNRWRSIGVRFLLAGESNFNIPSIISTKIKLLNENRCQAAIQTFSVLCREFRVKRQAVAAIIWICMTQKTCCSKKRQWIVRCNWRSVLVSI